jgi:hypothetical protein
MAELEMDDANLGQEACNDTVDKAQTISEEGTDNPIPDDVVAS